MWWSTKGLEIFAAGSWWLALFRQETFQTRDCVQALGDYC